MVYASPGSGQTRAGKYKLGARAGKHKLGIRAGKHKLETRAGKYKLWARVKARAGVPAEGRRTGNTNTRFEIFYKPEQLKYYVVQFNSKAELFEGALSEAAVLRCHSN